MDQSFKDINKQLSGIFKNISDENPNFEFEENKINELKVIHEFYINGKLVHKLKLWLDSFMGSSMKYIQLSSGNHVSTNNANSSNGYISLEVSEDDQLTFFMPMNLMRQSKGMSLNEVINEIYDSNVMSYLKL